MQQPPVHLKDHVFTRVHIEGTEISYVNEGINKKIPFGYNFIFSCEVIDLDPQERYFRIELTIVSKEKEQHIQGYTIDVTVAGIFEVEKNFPEEEMPKMLGILDPALLLGAAREFIYTVTSRGPCQAVYLPTVNFAPPPDEQDEQERSLAKRHPFPKKKIKRIPEKKPSGQ